MMQTVNDSTKNQSKPLLGGKKKGRRRGKYKAAAVIYNFPPFAKDTTPERQRENCPTKPRFSSITLLLTAHNVALSEKPVSVCACVLIPVDFSALTLFHRRSFPLNVLPVTLDVTVR